jgi:hypothetical protein
MLQISQNWIQILQKITNILKIELLSKAAFSQQEVASSPGGQLQPRLSNFTPSGYFPKWPNSHLVLDYLFYKCQNFVQSGHTEYM